MMAESNDAYSSHPSTSHMGDRDIETGYTISSMKQNETSPIPRNIPSHSGKARRRHISEYSIERSGNYGDNEVATENTDGFEANCVVVTPENVIEAHRMVNNYKFGFKKWKSHVTSRPLSERSDIVKDLYADISEVKPVKVSTVRPTNILYLLLIGWWLALIYVLVACIMALTIIGWPYSKFCMKMAQYFLWPFGKFVFLIHASPNATNMESHYKKQNGEVTTKMADEETSLLRSENITHMSDHTPVCRMAFWTSIKTYPWLLFGAPVLLIVHLIVTFLSWFFVVTIPIAKVNFKTFMYVLWLPPDKVSVGDSGAVAMDPKNIRSEIIMYTHQSMNFYYYKYTVDGMNIILVNLLVFVLIALVLGYSDPEDQITSGVVKCILAVLAIVPLTYYIGMAIISISAQSSFAIGAVLNATFGSVVELILYIVSLVKGRQSNTTCYAELVRSALAGTLIGCVLLIPGLCMILGGVRYQSQRFNPKSASVTALLLFVAIGGVFAPTLFSKIFGDLQCKRCEINSTVVITNITSGLQCTDCTQSVLGLDGDTSLYDKHILPLVYAICLLLPISYIIGIVFTLRTHTSYVYDEFYERLAEEDTKPSHHGAPNWSRARSVIILLMCATLIALCADIIAENIQELLETSGVSEYFIGVTMIAMIPELPEIINGVQFALQNNVNLGIEIGTNTAIQVCLIQVPALILVDLIYPLNFILIFNDVHLWAVVFSVIVINYIFQDGKTDYFQGSALLSIYIILLYYDDGYDDDDVDDDDYDVDDDCEDDDDNDNDDCDDDDYDCNDCENDDDIDCDDGDNDDCYDDDDYEYENNDYDDYDGVDDDDRDNGDDYDDCYDDDDYEYDNKNDYDDCDGDNGGDDDDDIDDDEDYEYDYDDDDDDYDDGDGCFDDDYDDYDNNDDDDDDIDDDDDYDCDDGFYDDDDDIDGDDHDVDDDDYDVDDDDYDDCDDDIYDDGIYDDDDIDGDDCDDDYDYKYDSDDCDDGDYDDDCYDDDDDYKYDNNNDYNDCDDDIDDDDYYDDDDDKMMKTHNYNMIEIMQDACATVVQSTT
ncbi:hypothetical protein ACF0H5_010825 [Mactra antiquata]